MIGKYFENIQNQFKNQFTKTEYKVLDDKYVHKNDTVSIHNLISEK